MGRDTASGRSCYASGHWNREHKLLVIAFSFSFFFGRGGGCLAAKSMLGLITLENKPWCLIMGMVWYKLNIGFRVRGSV